MHLTKNPHLFQSFKIHHKSTVYCIFSYKSAAQQKGWKGVMWSSWRVQFFAETVWLLLSPRTSEHDQLEEASKKGQVRNF